MLTGDIDKKSLGPVSQKSRNFSGLFCCMPQFPLYLRNVEVLRFYLHCLSLVLPTAACAISYEDQQTFQQFPSFVWFL